MLPFRSCLAALMRRLRGPLLARVLLSAVAGIVEVAASLGFVWASKNVIDAATGSVAGAFRPAVILFVGLAFLRTLFRILIPYWQGFILVLTQNQMRRDTFSHVMRSVWTGRERFHSGDTINRLEQDISVISDFLCICLPDLFVTGVQLVAAAWFLLSLAPAGVAWTLILIMPLAVAGSLAFFRKTRRLTGQIRALDSSIQGHMQENLQHRVLILTLQGAGKVLRRLGLLQDELKGKTVSRLNYSAFSRSFMNLGFICGYSLAFLWGASGIKDGTVTYGVMVAFLQLVSQVQRPVADIARNVPAFIRALSSEERLMELGELSLEDEGEDIVLSGAPGIRLENLSFSYPDQGRDVISGLDFDFKPGTMTVVMGPTGVGKSTLIRLILALLRPSSGSVRLYGSVSGDVPAGVRTRCNFLYVPQGNSLMSGTIRENLLLANPDAGEEELHKALHMAAADFVEELPGGLDSSCSEVGSGLSEGQAQRIAIARALLRPGGVIILDEATSALDEKTESEVLSRIAGEYLPGKTIICVTHRAAALSYADAVLRLD